MEHLEGSAFVDLAYLAEINGTVSIHPEQAADSNADGIPQNQDMLSADATGGIMFVPEWKQQVIYLDFDGELTKYHNTDLDLEIDDVQVEHSNLTPERIAGIVASLNAEFSAQNALFVTERPTDTAYSTIFVGKTSAFDQYGKFAGLAETVDHGNRIKDDNAFVLLDAANSDSDIVATIAHEAGHLLGTLDHGGDGLDSYGDTTANIQYGRTYYYPTDDWPSFTGGGLLISRFEVTKDILYFLGRDEEGVPRLVQYTGFTANGEFELTAIDIGPGGTARDVTISNVAHIFVKNGGSATNIIVNSQGNLYIGSGCTATNIKENGGYVSLDSGAVVTFVPNVLLGVFSGCYPTVHSGTTANYVTVKDGYLYVYSGGTANHTTLDTISYFYLSGGTVNNTTVNLDGYFFVESGGTADNTTVNFRGYLLVSSGCTATNIKENGGFVSVDDDSVITFVPNSFSGLVLSGNMGDNLPLVENATVHSGTTANYTTVCQYGYFYVYSGGTANDTILQSGGILSAYGGVLNRLNIESGAYFCLSSGVTANRTEVSSGGQLALGSMTSTYIDDHWSYSYAGGGTANNVIVHSGGTCIVGAGGTLNDTVINRDGVFRFYSGCSMNRNIIDFGGSVGSGIGLTANDTTINSGGYCVIDSGGTADNTIVNGWFQVLSGCTVDNTTVNGWFQVFSGGTATGNTINSDGDLSVSSGGIANDNIVHSGGGMVVLGTANNTTISSGGVCNVASDGIMSDCTIYTGGSLYLNSGARLEGVTTIGYGGQVSLDNSGATVDGTINFLIDVPATESTTPFIFNLMENSFDSTNLTVTIDQNASSGSYFLIDRSSNFTSDIAITVTGTGENSGLRSATPVTVGSGVFTISDADTRIYGSVTIGDKVYSLTRKNEGQQNEGLYLSIFEPTPISDAAYEYIARKLAYSDGHYSSFHSDNGMLSPENEYLDFEVVTNEGTEHYYFKVDTIWNGETPISALHGDVTSTYDTDFDAVLLVRTTPDHTPLGQAVLACGGTELGSGDEIDDLRDAGIGYYQFKKEYKTVYQACKKLTDQGYTLSITGHSLGGALAQYFAAFSSPYGKISQIEDLVTFNSPGLPEKIDNNYTAILQHQNKINNIRHYICDGDIVSMAGDYYLSKAQEKSICKVFANTVGGSLLTYMEAQHNKVVFFSNSLKLNDGTIVTRDGNMVTVATGHPNLISRKDFSYLTLHSDIDITAVNSASRMVFEAVPDPNGGYWLFNKQYAKLINRLTGGNLKFANSFVTRAGTEKNRKDIFISLGKLIGSFSTVVGELELGEVYSAGSGNAVIRSLTYTYNSTPFAFFDFTHQKFIWKPTVSTEIVQRRSTSDLVVKATLADTVLSEDEDFSISINVPTYYNNERYTLESIVTGSGREISTENIYQSDDSVYLFVDRPESEYYFNFSVNQSVVTEKAVMDTSRQTIDRDTDEIEIHISDMSMDSSYVYYYTQTYSSHVRMRETALSGLYSATISVSSLNLTDDDYRLTMYYDYMNSETGYWERIEKVIDIVKQDSEDLIDPTISDITASPIQNSSGVLVTAQFADNIGLAASQYKLGEEDEWLDYSDGVTVTENATVYFRAVDTYGNETEESFDVVLENGFVVKEGDVIVDGEVTALCPLNGETAAIENGTFRRAVFAGESITNDALADGTEVVQGDVDLSISDGTFVKLVTGADCVVDSGAAVRCWTSSGEGSDATYTNSIISLAIDGGVFQNNVVGGMAYMADDFTGGTTLYGDIFLTITGGTFEKYIYGGNTAATKAVSGLTSVEGDITVIIDASENVISLNKLVAGSYNMGKVKGGTRIILSGNGDNIVFAEKGEIWGGSGGDYYLADRTFDTRVAGNRTLTFCGFENELAANRIRGFSHIEFIDWSTVTLSQSTYNLRDITDWSFEYGSRLEDSCFANNFAGDALTLDGLPDTDGFQDWTVMENSHATGFAGFGSFSSVTLGGETAEYFNGTGNEGRYWASTTYKLYLDESASSMILTLA